MADTKSIADMSYAELEAHFAALGNVSVTSSDFVALLSRAASPHSDEMRVQYALNFQKLFPLIDDKLTSLVSDSTLTADQKSAVISQVLSGTLQLSTDMAHKQYNDITYLATQVALVQRQTSALDDAVRRDTAKIVCECLGIIKSGGNNAGSWWSTASQAVNALANNNSLANKISD